MIKAFVCFDFDNDHDLKGSLIKQAKDASSPFTFTDFSLKESQPEHQWLSQAQSAISRCDIFIVLLGKKTYKAQGVLKEVQIARGLKKPRFQLKPQGSNPEKVNNAGPTVNWTWNKLKQMLSD